MHVVQVSIPTRLDRYLRRLYPNITQGLIEKILREGKIKLNAQKASANCRVNDGEIISFDKNLLLSSDTLKQRVFSPSIISLADKLLNEYLVYSDDNILIINKPHGLATQGGSKVAISVQDALCCLNENNYDLRLVHRLDKDTSGLLLIAKNYLAAYKLTSAFKERLIVKIYQAVVFNKPPDICGTIRSFISKDKNGVYEVEDDHLNAKEAITQYELLATNGVISFIEFTPHTGRTHQLRVHAAKLNCPIIGDKKYGGNNVICKSQNMLLHAQKIHIPSSLFDKDITVETILPHYFSQFTSQLHKIDYTQNNSHIIKTH